MEKVRVREEVGGKDGGREGGSGRRGERGGWPEGRMGERGGRRKGERMRG